ncbi:arginine--tRNA ligase [Rhabdochlamydiaceae symbiont of Dictyostelium giganteum]|uniref:arginine--tRNA ligase n=1 Tax=Rhabdochlamydiaceae symbiont of Dictyostelium giganteum TaxID=3342349 RepID=UPI00384C819E
MDHLKTVLEQQVDKILKKVTSNPVQPDITHSTQVQFGHYQCNNALKLAKELKKSPRDVAQMMVMKWKELLEETPDMIASLEIAGPGFINITFTPSFLSQQLMQMLKEPFLGIARPEHQERVIVEFSSPNVAKELHVGHLRSTIIGDSLARLFEFLGHDVLRLNHIGDWGTQFGMLIAYIKKEQLFQKEEEFDLSQLMQWYKLSKKLFDEDPLFKKTAQLEVVKLQREEQEEVALWKRICDISRKGFELIYTLLDIAIIERGESFYNPYLASVVKDLEDKGMITLSGAAKCIYLEGYEGREGEPFPIIIQKSDGGYNYDTTDMAAICHRIREEKADRIIIVTDSGQSLHFEMIFKAAEKASYLDRTKVRVDHVPFGVVLGKDGKKFKTRSGETEKLIDLIQEAINQAKALLQERFLTLSSQELQEMATILGINSLKYADLSSHRIKDYTFSYERMLRFEGNTAPFLLYAYVRIRSIQRKISRSISEVMKEGMVTLEHPSEIELALHLRQFGETLESMAEELLPNRLTDYLYTLAEKFHAFFRDCRVEGSSQETSRLLVCELTALVLKQGLTILGLKPLEKM